MILQADERCTYVLYTTSCGTEGFSAARQRSTKEHHLWHEMLTNKRQNGHMKTHQRTWTFNSTHMHGL